MNIDRKDIGYTIYSRLEEAFRDLIRGVLLNFGNDWSSHIPPGIFQKIQDKPFRASPVKLDDPIDILEETDFPDLSEIICFKNGFSTYLPNTNMIQGVFQSRMRTLYDLRCKIAHVKKSFTAIDLDLLSEIAEELVPLIGIHGDELHTTLECLKTNPSKIVIRTPSDFITDDEEQIAAIRNNLPSSDYDPDGGFIGRKDDLKKIKTLISSDLDRVITIAGAGGVGKSALAHKFCVSLIQQFPSPFDAIVWVSAKEEKLTLTGIEPVEPTIRNYEELLDKILTVYEWFDILESPLEKKEEYVNLILNETDRGVLLVVDNLETIQDERILEFIKDIPRPNKVLITSRMGLGEVERRYTLKEMSKTDAIALIRIIAREKGAASLVKLSDDVLYQYAQSMSSYPLAIKWIVGQVALGKDINQLVESLKSTNSDIARFCFEHIYDNLLSQDARMVMCCLAASDRNLTRGVLTHVSGMQTEQLDKALRDLTLASFVVQEQEESKDRTITTKYSLLPLTLGYLGAKLRDQQELWRIIQGRMELVSGQIEEAKQAGRHYRYALQDLGATTDEERISASWALTAYQRSQNGDYAGAVEAFRRAVEIAPKFARLYRNWATVEASEGYFERSNELMEKATTLSPKDPTLWFVWGNIEKRRNKLDKARRYFQTAYDLSPNDGAVLGGLGEVEKRSGNYELADKYFTQALNVPRRLHGFKHEMITYTAIANNLSRWAKELWDDKQLDLALVKAKSAYEYAFRAVKMSKNDTQAEDTLKETTFVLATQSLAIEGIDAALPIFKDVIVKNPKRWKEKKITSNACFFLTRKLLEAGRIDEAKYYFQIGRKNITTRGDEDRARYEKLEAELLENRYRGKVSYIPEGKSYGFIEREDIPGQSVFVHRSAFIPPISGDELRHLLGIRVSFTIEKTPDGLQAKNVRIIEN